ncbi:MAG: hypothetical protein WAL47_16700 [Pyrinomonadaceae bacterium]
MNALETYLEDLYAIRSSGGAVKETREVMNIARRIAAILLLQRSLDANYQSIKTASYTWPRE